MITRNTRHLRELLGLLFLFLSLLIGISLWSYNINDPTLNQSISASYEVKNYAGTFGAYLSGFLNDFFGIASYIWVLFFFGMGMGFITRWVIIPWYSMLGYLILTVCFITFAEAVTLGIGDIQGGGFCGAWLYATFHLYFNPIGSAFIWLFCLMVGIELCFHVSWVNLFGKIVQLTMKAKNIRPQKKEQKEEKNTLSSGDDTEEPKEEKKKSKNSFSISFKNPFKKETKTADNEKSSLDIYDEDDLNDKISESDPLGLKSAPLATLFDDEKGEDTEEALEKKEEPEKTKKKSFWSFFSDEEKAEAQNSDLPSLDLLSPVLDQKDAPSKSALEEKGKKLIECLADFKVEGTLTEILPGPVVTMYEVRPGRGMTAVQFERRAKEIAMAIKAVAVRIQAPIPGTDTVGIEVPNEKRQLVSFKEIIEHESFVNSKSKLTLGLGKDIFGTPVSVKMDDMPHLLVAGATGAGKSVCLNSIILSILYKAQPHEVQMLLIDPKRVELSMYNGLPHLVHPVVTDMDLARNALAWAVDEMDQRYKLFEKLGLRNITEYNNFVRKNAGKEPSDSLAEKLKAAEYEKLQNLPFIVIIVDELADLMMQKGKEVEGQLVRLGQLARAAGMHIILATQRPSTDIITGLIKNNFPARIAFKVSSRIDSGIILDSTGAETLLGKGDMLFKTASGNLQRIHGAYVTEEEVRAVTEFWKKQASPHYKIDFTQYDENPLEPNFDDENMEYDEMYDTVLDWLTSQDAVSISMLQRKYSIGFNRAGRIIDRLEREGYIEPRSGSKPRKVIH